MLPAPVQTALPTFTDDLQVRARQIRFRGVGNPYEYLDTLGIVPIKEFLLRGSTLVDVADAINLPLTHLHKWIEENNYKPEIEEASTLSAEGYLHRGEKMLHAAKNQFELRKAKAMLEHGRFMAAKKNKTVYGNEKDIAAAPVGVSYTFNIGSVTASATPEILQQAKDIIDTEVVEPPKVTLSIPMNDEFGLGEKPQHLDAPEAPKLAAPDIWN